MKKPRIEQPQGNIKNKPNLHPRFKDCKEKQTSKIFVRLAKSWYKPPHPHPATLHTPTHTHTHTHTHNAPLPLQPPKTLQLVFLPTAPLLQFLCFFLRGFNMWRCYVIVGKAVLHDWIISWVSSLTCSIFVLLSWQSQNRDQTWFFMH